MWWRAIITVLLAGILAALLLHRGGLSEVLPSRKTPHQAYTDALNAAGLAETALARDWNAAADRALREPEPATVPLKTRVQHPAADPTAYGYRLELKRGRVLRVELALKSEDPANVFVDLFEIESGADGPRHVKSAERGAAVLEHEIRRDGTYVLRIQPELLRGGTLEIVQQTTAALTFPVAGRDAAAIRSFFRDPRDAGRREHHGVDIFAPRDTPVVAATDGYVTSVGTNRLGGNVVWVWDPKRRQSHYYAHLSRQAVRTGERVAAGDVIGYVGNTGNARSTPPHLHFGIYGLGEGPIDPLPFVNGARGPQPRSADAATNPEQDVTGSGG